MSDIFISYAREDRETAQTLATALERHGWSVWWDHEMHAGRRFRRVIAEELNTANCVLVLWSETSTDSDWVLDEAERGKERDVLVPVSIDGVRPPLGFGAFHTTDLTGWRGEGSHPDFGQLIEDMEALIGEPPSPRPQRAAPKKKQSKQSPTSSPKPAASLVAGPSGDVGFDWKTGLFSNGIAKEGLWERKPTSIGFGYARGLRGTPSPTDLFKLSSSGPRDLPDLEVFRDVDEPWCPEMVVVPAGSFLMGSPPDEPERDDDEGPQHRVTIAKPFAVGLYDVTFAEWDACVEGGGCNGYRPEDAGWGRDRRPVINVNWNDARAYVKWLSGKTGKDYRLLTEAEWEYAARAGTTTPFSFGSTISPDQANYDGNYAYDGGSEGVYREKTAPVGSFPANPWGLFDVHGNVWEWVADCYDEDAYKTHKDYPAMVGSWQDSCSRVVRGGSWVGYPRYLRSAVRYRYGPDYRYISLGFRVARTI